MASYQKLTEVAKVYSLTDSCSLPACKNGAVVQIPVGDLKTEFGVVYISVKKYGAVGDGVTDDTTAIKNAIAAVEATGGILYFPPGEYIFTERLIVSKPITIKGASIDLTTLHFTGGRTAATTTKYDSEWWEESDAALLIKSDDVTIESLRLYGVVDSTNTLYNGISAHWVITNGSEQRYRGAERLRMTNVKIMGFRNDIYLYGGWERYIVNCIFWDATDSGVKFTPLELDNVGNWSNSGDCLIGCSFVNNHIAGFYAISTFQTSLQNCIFEYNQRAIYLENCINTSFINCWNEANLDKIIVKGTAKFDGGYNITRDTVDHDGNGHVILEKNSDITIIQGSNVIFKQQNGVIIKGVYLGEEFTNLISNPGFCTASGGTSTTPDLTGWERYPAWAMDVNSETLYNGSYTIAYNVTDRSDNPEFSIFQTISGLTPGKYNIECDVMAPDRSTVDTGFVVAATYKNSDNVTLSWESNVYNFIGNNAWEHVSFMITIPEECTNLKVAFGPKNNGVCYMANPMLSSNDAAITNNVYIKKNESNPSEIIAYDINGTALGKLTLQSL